MQSHHHTTIIIIFIFTFQTLSLKNFTTSEFSEIMPEIAGTVSDPARMKCYFLKMAGSDATEVFVFNRRTQYEPEGKVIKSIPIVIADSTTGKLEDAKKGHYISADITLMDVPCDNGDYYCPINNIHFAKQALMKPYDTKTAFVKNYLNNGEMLMAPVHPRPPASPDLEYPINLIEIGDITDLVTPVNLALLRTRLFNARAQIQVQRRDDSHFQPINTEEEIVIDPSDSNISPSRQELSAGADDSASSAASTIITGTLNLGRATPANRVLCGQNIERELDNRALASALNPDFTPWLTSTGSTPPSSRPNSSQSLPAELGSPEDNTSPQRPKSASPTKRGRATSRKASKDRTYQPSIRNFLTSSSPTSPIQSRTPLPTHRNKRRSQRVHDSAVPEPKRLMTADDANVTGGQLRSPPGQQRLRHRQPRTLLSQEHPQLLTSKIVLSSSARSRKFPISRKSLTPK